MNDRSPQTLLLAGQQRWIADRSPLKICEKGRRVGITWAEAADDVLIAARAREAGGMNVYYFPQAKEDAVEYVQTCEKWARAYGHAVDTLPEGAWEDELGEVLPDGDPDKFIRTYRIEFASGHRIVALSSSPSRARGKQGVFVIDEAAFHPKFKQVLKAVMATFLRGGCVRVISTHNGEDNPFNELILEVRARHRKGTVHRYTLRDAIADGMYGRICEVDGKPWSQEAEAQYLADAYSLYGEDAAEELDAIPASSEGTFLSRALIESCMDPAIPIVRWSMPDGFAQRPRAEREAECRAFCEGSLAPLLDALPKHRNHCYGSDFARSGDLSVIWPLSESPALKLETPFVVELRNIPFEQQRQVLFYIVHRMPRFMAGAMDARGNGQYLAEVAAQEFGARRIAQVMLSAEWYREHMPPFKAAFEDRTLSVPRDADILADLRAIKRERGIAKVPDNATYRGADGHQRHGDAGIAGALAVFAVRTMEVAPIEFESAGTRETYLKVDDALSGRRREGFMSDRFDLGRGFGSVPGGNDFEGFM